MHQHIIHHLQFGSGVVVSTRSGGFELRVRFNSGVLRWVRRDELAEDSSFVHAQAVEAQKPSPPPLRRPRPSRRIIEALRLGIVPDVAIEKLTLGRDAEIKALNTWLSVPNDGTRFLVGTYGTGKTHLLNYLQAYALQQGYVVAFVEMDTQEAPFSRPKRVYSQLVQNLRWGREGRSKTLRFCNLLRDEKIATLLRNHTYFKHFYQAPHDTDVLNWIEAREDAPRPYACSIDLPGLYNYGTAANIYCNLLSALGWAITHARIGLKGLLLIFDEAETLFARQTYSANHSSYTFLETLALTADNNSVMSQPPWLSGYDYTVRAQDIPFAYRQPSGLKLALAFTDVQHLRYSPSLYTVPRLTLDPLNDAAITSVFEQVRQWYGKAYNFNTTTIPMSTLFEVATAYSDSTRMQIKRYIEALDLLRFHPQQPISEVLCD